MEKRICFSLDNKEIYHNDKGRGGPHDFTISNNSNISNKSFEYIYAKYAKYEKKYVLEGNKNFYIKDYEVYQIELE